MKFSGHTVGIMLMAGSPFFLSASAKALSSSEPHVGGLRRNLAEGHDHDNDNENCISHEIDFVLLEGDAIRTSVEAEIVHMLEKVGIKVNTRKLKKEAFNAAEQAGDFHLSFSETFGPPYDPHAYASGWVAQDEGHFQALASLEAPNTRDSLFQQINDVMKEESDTQRTKQWEAIHKVVHDNAVMLPLWASRIPTVLNSKRLTKYQPGNQQYDYPVNLLQVLGGSKTVTIAPGAQTGRFQTIGRLDPHTYRPNEFFANNWVYEGLVSYGSYGQVLPALASSWTVEDHPDGGQRYTFEIRPNVQFHDGAAWNCDAAKLNFDHVLAKPLRGPDYHGWYGLMSQIISWDCASDTEFIVDTKNKYYPFLQELSFIRPLRMLSPSSFVGNADPFANNSCAVGWGNITDSDGGPTVFCAGITNISGTGPFMFDSRSPKTTADGSTVDGEVIFERNPTYWDGVASIETLIIKHYETSDEVKAALLDASLDLVWGSGVLTAQDLVALHEDENNDLSVFHSEDINNAIVLLNSGKAPLDDINLRKTIIHAIDKKTIIDDNLGGIFKPVDNVFPMDAPYCDVSLTPHWDFDLEKAEFLNCPVPVDPEIEVQVQVQVQKEVEEDRRLAVGLGIGLGVFCLLLMLVAFLYVRRSNRLEKELQEMLVKAEKEESAPASE
jgi:ABC-type transport system substrate-binding protein